MSRVRGKKRLSTTIFAAVLSFALVVVGGAVSVVTYLYYSSYEQLAYNNLIELAESAADELDMFTSEQRVSILKVQVPNSIRSTLVDTDGTVLYDSMYGSGNDTSNILERPEIAEARENGESSTVRYSETLEDDTYYAAVRLTDGQIVRLAKTSASVRSFLQGLIAPLVLVLIAVLGLVLLTAMLLTRRIMKPFDENDGRTKPVDDVVYAEMVPFMSRLEEQQGRLRKQNEQLRLAEDLRRDFTAGVQHELKTPLQVVSGYSELLKKGDATPEQIQHFSDIIYDETQSMRSLIEDVLVLSRLDQPIWKTDEEDPDEDVDLMMLVNQAEKHLTPLAEGRGVTLTVHGESAIVHGNEALLWQIISNLTSNAIRYSNPGDSVELSVSMQSEYEAGGEGKVLSCRPVVRVRDTGIGIEGAELDKIFQRFYRVEKSRSKDSGGTGLGLAIVKHAADYHNAVVKVESEPEKGSTFTVLF